MKVIDGKEWVCLREICEEAAVLPGPEGQVRAKAVYFSSMDALHKGAMHFAGYFSDLHSRGMVYGSSDPDAFYFDPACGDLHVRADAAVAAEGTAVEPDAAVMNEFLAPELVEALSGDEEGRETACWTVETDWYFMAVFLFEYFYHTGSPFEGKLMVNHCFLSPAEKELFRAREGIFCMEPGSHDNSPVPGIQDKLIRFWKEYPEDLGKMFQKAFLSGGSLIHLRPTEIDWKQSVVRLMMDYKDCSCGFHGYSAKLISKEDGTRVCPGCGKVYYPMSDGLDWILLSAGARLYECQTGLNAFDTETVTGQVVENRNRKGLFGIKNVSDGVWRGFFPNRETKEITKGMAIPIWSGMTLRFERGEDWTLRMTAFSEESEDDNHEQAE